MNFKDFVQNHQKKLFYLFLFCLLLIWLSLFLGNKINLVTADLGRHLKNGEVFLNQFSQFGFKNKVLSENFYSYTNPKFSFLNHHWGSGIIFFIIYNLFGFKGLSLFFIILNLLTFSIFFWIAIKKSNFQIAFLFSLLLIPLIGNRTEIRPEIFSYFFSAIFLVSIFLFQKEKISSKILIPGLFIIQILWVNLHIYSIFGPIILASFIIEEIVKRQFTRINVLLLCFLLVLAAFLLNPHFWQIFNLLFIFKNYGYLIVENQSIGFLEKLNVVNPNFFLFKVVIFLLLTNSIFVLIKSRASLFLSFYFPTLLLSIMAFLAIRNFSLFALFALPVLSFNFYILEKWLEKKYVLTSQIKKLVFAMGILAILFFNFLGNSQLDNFFSNRNNSGIGLLPKIENAAQFFKKNNLTGPIFNNYDIGSYLIFYLFPEEKIFVDNRPEAYPAEFFQNIYIPLQENEKFWKEKLKEYQFNVIFFYRHDATPWGQPFLIARLQDPDWAPIFVDDYTIIFLKRNESNQNIIEKYEIPQKYFQVIKIK